MSNQPQAVEPDTADENGKKIAPAPPTLHVLRLTIEALTPLSPASGKADAEWDNLITRDANGLPHLYGPALAGVWRHIYADYHGEQAANKLFGFEEEHGQEGEASVLHVSFGYLHDANDAAICGLIAPDVIETDDVLKHLAASAPLAREQVRIDRCGVADDGAKFNRVSIPAGARFSVELSLEGEPGTIEADKERLLSVARLLDAPYLRLGGKGTTLGRVRIVWDGEVPRGWYACINRATESGYKQVRALSQSGIGDPSEGAGFQRLSAAELALPKDSTSVRRPVTGALRLKMRGYWRIGQTGSPLFAQGEQKTPDMVPAHEQAVSYDSATNQGSFRGLREGGVFQAPFTASGLKGALAHRAEFHLNRKLNRWAEALSDKDFLRHLRERGMDELFGLIKNSDSKTGRAGAVLLDDCYVTLPAENKTLKKRLGRIEHNSLDRFTQGVRSGLLFSEEALYRNGGGEVVVGLCVLTRAWDAAGKNWRLIDKNVREAFKLALEDLCSGRLAIGAGDGQGHGRCEGTVAWEDGGVWLHEDQTDASDDTDSARSEEVSA